MQDEECRMKNAEGRPLTTFGIRHSDPDGVFSAASRITVRLKKRSRSAWKADTTARCYGARRPVSGQVNRGDAQGAVALERLEDDNEAGPLSVVEARDTLAQGAPIDRLA
jgi:hypothetical protein